ncbi:uncharacterized protein RJT21DRAFT_137175 [Scheffersomyces amazonensis]|uniref:uncharacterized protein n=1 Tax=Scheffersomyces amazonensis TaxID=1078765 RepID=UPI00315CAC68
MAKRDPPIKRSRTRSGCLTCRDRHMKCDEQLPICRNCIKSKRKCYRGIRLNFTQYTMYNPKDSIPINEYVLPPASYRLLDQSITIASLYKNGKESYQPYIHLHTNQDLEESDMQYHEDLYTSVPTAASTSLSVSSKSNSTVTVTGSSISTINDNQYLPQLDTNTVLENYNITNVLLNDSYFINQSINSPSSSSNPQPLFDSGNSQKFQFLPPNLQSISTQWSNQNLISANTETSPTSTIGYPQQNVDIHAYISLIENEKYYWLLDQFNEQSIWKSIVPLYCLHQQYQLPLLTSCLMNCSYHFSIDVLTTILDQQLTYWYTIRNTSVINSIEIAKFTNILLSITLILLSIYLKYQREAMTLPQISTIIENQCKIYNMVIHKISNYLSSGKREQKSVLLISSIHSIIILKYFIIKKFQFEYQQDYNYTKIANSIAESNVESSLVQEQESSSSEIKERNSSASSQEFPNIDIMEDVIYTPSSSVGQDPLHSVSLINLFQLNQFEISHLNQSFKKLDYVQLNYRYETSNQSAIPVKSDSLILREYMWYLIRLNHVLLNPHIKSIEIDYNFIFNNSSRNNIVLPTVDINAASYTIVLPNDKGIIINFLQEFINKLINLNNKYVIQQSNSKIISIFKLIDDSCKFEEEKSRWKSNFDWLLNFITDND